MQHEHDRAFRRALRAAMTTAERVLWSRLRLRQLHGFKFRRQHPVGAYVLDFYCLEKKLAIEVDGDSHYAEHRPAHDQARSLFLSREGIRVLRFTNLEVLAEREGVIEVIAAQLLRPSSR